MQLCKGADADTKKQLYLDDAGTFTYTAVGECLEAPGVDDVREYNELVEALHCLKFTEQEKTDLFKTTAAVLHIGTLPPPPADDTQTTHNHHLLRSP